MTMTMTTVTTNTTMTMTITITIIISITMTMSVGLLPTYPIVENNHFLHLFSGNYASIYRVPKDVRNDAPRSVEQPVYNIIEELASSNKQGAQKNRSPVGLQDNAPFSVEQRLYGLIEGLDPATAQASSPEGQGNTASFSVDQRVYNIIEDLDTRLYEELNSFDPEQPEYHVLEETLPKGAEEADCVGSSDEHARSSV